MVKEISYTNQKADVVNTSIIVLSAVGRNEMLKKYFNVNQFMKKNENPDEEIDMLNLIKEDVSILDFMVDVLTKGIDKFDANVVSGEVMDELFGEHMEYIMGFSSKN